MFLKNKIRTFFKRRKQIFFLKNSGDFSELKKIIDKEKIFSVDTEFDWRRTYLPNLSLIQIGTKEKIFIIDCLSGDAVTSLKKYLEGSSYLKIFHSCRSDATVLFNCFNIKIKNVYDIQVAEKILDEGKIKNYASIVFKYFSIKLNKSETNSNWLRRPLTEEQIAYAAADVDYLLDIYFFQNKILKTKDELKEIFKESEKEINLGCQDLGSSRFLKIKSKFSSKEKKIFLWREKIAMEANLPISFICKDKNISKLGKISKEDKDAKRKLMKIIGDTDFVESFVQEIF